MIVTCYKKIFSALKYVYRNGLQITKKCHPFTNESMYEKYTIALSFLFCRSKELQIETRKYCHVNIKRDASLQSVRDQETPSRGRNKIKVNFTSDFPVAYGPHPVEKTLHVFLLRFDSASRRLKSRHKMGNVI